MTKDVLVSVKGLQFDMSGDAGEVETITPGVYYEKNGYNYVLYEDGLDESGGVTKNIMKFKNDYLELTKKGQINTHMVFEADSKNLTNYMTPFGDIVIGINTKNAKVVEQEEEIGVTVNYAMDVNYEFLADCRIEISIRPKNHGFELLN